MRSLIGARTVILLALFVISTGYAGQDIEQVNASLQNKALLARAVLERQPFRIHEQQYESVSENLVLLIGENHASTAAQTQLATILEDLHSSGLLDAMLVEGSNGRFAVRQLAANLMKAAKGEPLIQFWKRQLESGSIAGYEYFSLMTPTVPALGVEDMSAKQSYEIGELADETATAFSIEELQLALERLEVAERAVVRMGRDTTEARRTIALLSDALQQYKAAAGKLAPLMKDYAEQLGSMSRKQAELQRLAKQMAPHLDKYNATVKEVKSAAENYAKRVDDYNAMVERLQRESQSSTDPAEVSALLEMKESLKKEEQRIKNLAKTAESIKSQYSAEFARLEVLALDMQGFPSRKKRLERRLQSPLEAVKEAQLLARDQYFRTANRLRRVIQQGPVAETSDRTAIEALLAVDTFFVDEHQRAKEYQRKDAKRALHDRDSAMAKNAAAFLQGKTGKIVVLVVGSAHLPGMVEQLAKRKISFISGELLGNLTLEFWESPAWDKRRDLFPKVFSSLKEESRFLDPNWPGEMERLLGWMRQFGVSQTVHAMGKLPKDKVVHIGRYLANHRTSLGEHVLLRGPAGVRQDYFEVWDRRKARALVSELTTEDVRFAYVFQKDSLDSEYRVVTHSHEESLQKFMAGAPAPATKYVVLLHEPDAVERSGIAVSELWEALRPAGAGGSGSGEPPTIQPWYQASFWGDGGKVGDRGY